jgi:L-ascorbate metabolism protein UlaG (beta-lactamase superfamily)/SAM-dependent methyltransferase
VKPSGARTTGSLRRLPLVAYLAIGALWARPISPVAARASAPASGQFLGRPLESGQAIIRYLFHSGWAVQTKDHLLIFDYTEPFPPPGRPALTPKAIESAEIADQNVTVFVSHAHTDHFNPEILKWRDAVRAIRYVWGWEGVGAPEDIHFGRERRVVEDRGLEILNIYHEGDGTPESSFLVRVDGLTIFHAGDHGSGRGMKDPVFGENIRYLAGQAPELDLLFTPTFGGEIDAILALKPRVVFPMHDGGRERQYALFAQKVKSLGLDVRVGAAERRGARFLYLQGKLETLPQTESDRLAPETEAEARANRLQPPGRVMDIIGLSPGMIVAEIGAGKGRYVVHLSDRVGPEGRVYAEDIDAESLRHLEDRCQRGGFANVVTVLGDVSNPRLPAGSMDLIVIIGSYQHFSNPVALMRKARAALKKDGRAAIVDGFAARDARYDVSEKTMFGQMDKAGFVLERIDRSIEAAGGGLIYLFKRGTRP